ncbi:unnamed protein product [Medioppia subpectinata]|uniref:HIT domain-containing protein n=1 Tax=Medioppia subpectinata TaxID=1979941 RepID=A0A7R9LH22_9ACAR|nr:unnamed protein product [Medioppia subpectinata]CAG2118664.1 unnamed protein product [Medioppia subpectinata]
MKRSETSDGHNDGHNHTKRSNTWVSYALLNSMKDKSIIVLKDELITIIKDKYPKSRHHLLVIPNKYSHLDSVEDLNANDVQLIDYMTAKAKQISQDLDPSIEFRFGFHTIPSQRPLHLHVISQDFDSKYLKTKKHYNSFTTRFFIDSKHVIENLKNTGKVDTIARQECEQLLKQDLICHFCRSKLLNMPNLRTHLLTHFPV